MRVGESAKRPPLDVGTTFGDLVGKLDGARGREGARDRKKAKTGKREGRKPYAEANPVTVQLAKELREGDRYPSDECRRPDRGANTRGGLRSALRGSPSQPRPPSPPSSDCGCASASSAARYSVTACFCRCASVQSSSPGALP